VDEAVELAGWLARSRLIDAFVLDVGGVGAAGRSLERLAALLARTSATGLLVADRVLNAAAAQAAGIRITLERRAWLAVGADLVGQRLKATVARHRWAVPGGQAELDLWFAEGRRIDPLVARVAVPVARASAREPVREPASRVHVLSA